MTTCRIADHFVVGDHKYILPKWHPVTWKLYKVTPLFADFEKIEIHRRKLERFWQLQGEILGNLAGE